MLTARCKMCNTELTSSSKVQYCGCPNQMFVVDDAIGAIELSEVVITNHENNVKSNAILSDSDLKYQEERRKRKVRKLDFEER